MGTSHLLGQNFARVFDTTFLYERGETELVWQSSWGVSTRLVGALIMGHGDDRGLRVPPRLAPVQVVVVVVRDEGGAGARAAELERELRAAGVRVELDARVDTSFGRRAVDWELKGVPVRLELGPRDLADGNVVLVRRDDDTKHSVPLAGLPARVAGVLDDVQHNLWTQALTYRDAHTVDVDTLETAVDAGQTGFARLPWKLVGEGSGEETLAARSLTVRCLQRADGTVPEDRDEPDLVAVVGRAY
jgi:prolyl-tRNA synthetase